MGISWWRAYEPDAVHFPDDSDYGRDRRRHVRRRRLGRSAEVAARGSDVHGRLGFGAGLLCARPLCRNERNAVWFGEYQSLVVLRDGEPAVDRIARDARRAP